MESIQEGIQKVLANPYVMATVKLSLVLYASHIAPYPPKFVKKFFKNTIVKIILIALMIYLSSMDFQVAIILAIIFVLGTNMLARRGVFESFQTLSGKASEAPFYPDVHKYKTLLGADAPVNDKTIIESKTDIFPGCENLKLDDIMKVFDGDVDKMQKSLKYSYRELIKSMTDETAKSKFIKTAKAAGVPYNVSLNDENAPLIGTILLHHGYIVSESCRAPHD